MNCLLLLLLFDFQRDFDPARIETVGGTVKEITIIPPGSKSGFIGPGLRLTVQRGSGETLYVPLGPKWYTDQQPLRLAVGDVITLVGMRPDLEKPIFLVQEIRKEEQAAPYRDREGIPYWQKYKPVEAPRTPDSSQPESQDEH